MDSSLTTDFFTKNRQELQRRVGDTYPIVLTANGMMQQGADEPSLFHQESNFWYLTGLNGSGLILVIYKGETFVIVPGMSAVREAFDGAHDLEAYSIRSGITDFMSERAGWQRLKSILQETHGVATLLSPPPYIQSYGLHMLPYRRRLISRLKRMVPDLTLESVKEDLSAMRVIKQPAELAALQQAIDITCKTLQDIVNNDLEQATNEYQLEAALTYGFRMQGAAGHAFAPITAAGKHTTTMHHIDNNGPIMEDDMIILDVGAENEHYSADVARTISRTPMIGRKAAVFHAVAAAQSYALTLLKPGVLLKDYEAAVEDFIGNELVKLCVISDALSDDVRQFFPHRTSHFLGLDTHDVGDYRAPLEAGMVLTCEPGIYLPSEHIGVRIEDDVLITASGNEVLSRACPQALTSVQ